MMRSVIFAAIGFFLGAIALAFAQTALRPDQFVALPWTWSGAQSFTGVYGKTSNPPNGSYTFQGTDCGTEVISANSANATWTIPAAIIPAPGVSCEIAVLQYGAGKVIFGVSGGAVLLSADNFTGTSGAAGSVMVLNLITQNGMPTAVLTGRGS